MKHNNEALVQKMGRPYVLASDLKLELLNYMIKMQKLGFGLTVLQVRKIAYKIATAAKHRFYFNEEKESVGK